MACVAASVVGSSSSAMISSLMGELYAALDYLGHGLGVAMTAPARHVRGERARAAARGHDQEVLGLVHQRAHLGLVAGLDGAGHELGALEVGVAVLGVLPQELADLPLAPAAGRDRPHVLAGEDD